MRGFFIIQSILLVLAWPIVAVAAPPVSVFLEDLTWTELRDAIKSGKTTVIIPAGGTEQNGPLMAIGKHNVRVKVLAGQIASELGNAIVAPVVAYVPEGDISPPTEHMRFPGTITVSDRTFEDVLSSAARSLAHAGFTDIVLIGDHGSYQKDLRIVAEKLNQEWATAPAPRAHFMEQYYTSTLGDYARTLLGHGVRQQEIGTHAALADTSLMLAIDPDLVRKEALASGQKLGPAEGVYGGTPEHSTAELGQLGIDLIVKTTVEAIRKATMRR
jgi:creatinine amidohydrolase/Fe(II)-dependent formamide hydrolase-like protein